MRVLFLSICVVVSLAASAQVARAQDAGASGGACYGNGTCNAGLTCDAGVCVAPQAGQLGGACYGNGTCNAGMACDPATQTCVASGTAPAPVPVGGGMAPPPGPGTPPPPGAIDGMPPPAGAPPPAGVSAEAGPPPMPKRWWVGAKAGFLLSGSGTLEDEVENELDFDTESGMIVMGAFDVALGPRLAVGGFGVYGSTGIEDANVDANIVTLGGTIKGRFAAQKVEIRPGAAVGYQRIGGEAFEEDGPSHGLGVGGFVELAFPMTPQADFLGEIGFLTQPVGGFEAEGLGAETQDIKLTLGPTFYLVGGVAFGG